MFRITKRVFVVLIPLACLIALACGDSKNVHEPSIVACGDCAAGSVHLDAWLVSDDGPGATFEPVGCFDAWHEGEAPDCVVIVRFDDIDECPFETESGVETVVETYTDAENVEHTETHCALPRLEASLDCDEAGTEYPEDTTETGWYYCQDLGEPCQYSFRFTSPALELTVGQVYEVNCAACAVEDSTGVDCVIDDQVVGRQCTPTSFTAPDTALVTGSNFALELSEDCGGGPCLTKLEVLAYNPTEVEMYDHCSCRCGDLEGNDHTTNPDLCQCPGESVCAPVCEHGAICPESLQGAFCLPACVANPCIEPNTCTPPESGDPWNWTCEG